MNSNDTRSKILKEFNRQLYIYGYEKTTLKQICENLSISTGHLYYYFKKKEELYYALNRDFSAKLKYILKEHLQAFSPNRLILFLLIKYYSCRLNCERPELYRVMLEIQQHMPMLMWKNDHETALFLDAIASTDLPDVDRNHAATAIQTLTLQFYTYLAMHESGELTWNLDELLYNIFENLFFMARIPKEKSSIVLRQFFDLVQILDKQKIYDSVYQMDAYNYEETLAPSHVEP